MKKRYFYEFHGNVYLEADNQDEAEKLVIGIPLEDYLIGEEVFEIDEHYVPIDLKKRDEKNNTVLHPLDDEYVDYKIMKREYGAIFKEFLHGKIDRDKLIKLMVQVEGKEMYDTGFTYEVDMVDLKSKVHKTAKHCVVD